jgi:hypothetical protein
VATFLGPELVPNPVPIVDRYGIFTTATGPLTLPSRGIGGGLQYETGTCELPNGLAVECGGTASKVLTTDYSSDTLTGTPFVVYSSLVCGLAGMDEQRMQRFLMERLRGGEQAVVESVFSRQLFGQSPGLSNNAAVVTVTAVTSGINASIAELESAFYAAYGLTGTIHIPFVLAQRLGADVLRWDGRVWRTPGGSIVSFGNYAGRSPTDVAPAAGTAWIYMTGQVSLWRTPDSGVYITPFRNAFSRTTNQLTALAEREYVIDFDCSVFATLVTLDPLVEVAP